MVSQMIYPLMQAIDIADLHIDLAGWRHRPAQDPHAGPRGAAAVGPSGPGMHAHAT